LLKTSCAAIDFSIVSTRNVISIILAELALPMFGGRQESSLNGEGFRGGRSPSGGGFRPRARDLQRLRAQRHDVRAIPYDAPPKAHVLHPIPHDSHTIAHAAVDGHGG
jgi:hypothetical protein